MSARDHLPAPQLATLEEIAALLRVHPNTVRRHAVALGGRRVGRRWRFDIERATRGTQA